MSGESDKDLEKLRQVADLLIQHHDAVQILTTRHAGGQDDGTDGFACGRGNTLARMGQVRAWLKSDGTRWIASDAEIARVNQAVEDLREHFDTSQIFTSSCDSAKRTTFYSACSGNLFACEEHATQWLADMARKVDEEEEV